MTVATTTNREQYATDGVTVEFTIHFPFFDDTDVNAIFVDSTGASTTLALSTDFTVSGGDGAGGTLTTTVAQANGGTLTVYRDIPFTQESDFVENDPLPADTLEAGLDRAAMRDQQLKDALDRALVLPVTATTSGGVVPSPEADKLLGWNSAGDALENKDIPTGTAIYSSITNTKAGTATAEAVTPDSLASLWQEGGALVSAASISKPADANLGGYYTQSGSTGTNTYWAGAKGGEPRTIRYTGAPLLGVSGNIVPPGGAAFQVIAGDIIAYRWDAAATKLRAIGGIRADGTALVVSSVSRAPVSVRQTVLSGPVTSDGLPNFGGSTATTTVTVLGTLVVTAANAEDISGNVDRVGSIAAPSWTGLSTNGTMYLYLDIASTGICSPGSTTVAPVYQFGGTYSTSAGAFTFNTQEMVGKVGDGSAVTQTYRVHVGEVTVAGGVVTVITWYAIKGRYVSAWTATLPGTSAAVSFSHNIGIKDVDLNYEIECTTIDNSYAVGDQISNPCTNSGGADSPARPTPTSRNAAQIQTAGTNSAVAIPKGGGAITALTVGDWKYRFTGKRRW